MNVLLNNLKSLVLHLLICIASVVVISMAEIAVPIIYLKDAFRIGRVDFTAGILLVLLVLIMYFGAGLFLKPGKTASNILSCLLILTLYPLANWCLSESHGCLSFTLSDPTPAGTAWPGDKCLGFSMLFNIPLEVVQWACKCRWFNKTVVIAFTVMPGLMMWFGLEALKASGRKTKAPI